MYRSRNFYVRLTAERALFTHPGTKGGGERSSYLVPTRQALQGCIDAIYYKPTIQNVVTEVKVVKKIQTELHGVRALLKDYGADLSYVSYLSDVEYLVKFHFIWNENRDDLIHDRLPKKHEAIMARSLARGGRRDVFLGTRECLALAEGISQEEYDSEDFANAAISMDFGLMFHSFAYPTDNKTPLKSYFTRTEMVNGYIRFKDQADCEVVNELSSYSFKPAGQVKSVDQELVEYGLDIPDEGGGS